MIKSIIQILLSTAVVSLLQIAAHAETFMLNTTQQWNQVVELPETLQRAQQLTDMGKNRQALKLVEAWIKENPDSPFSDYGLYIKGNCLFNRERYYQAFLAYDELINNYSTSVLFEPVLLREIEIARRFLQGAKRIVWGFLPVSARTEAIEILERVADSWPGSELGAQAIMMQGDYFFSKQSYTRAKECYQIMIDNYDRSSYYQQAKLRVAESAHYQFTGVAYDTRCLIEAQILYEKFQDAFPQRAAQLNLAARLATIQDLLIEKEYEIADFYRRTDKLDAAATYWNQIAAQWPQSSWAQKAQKQLAQYNAPAAAD